MDDYHSWLGGFEKEGKAAIVKASDQPKHMGDKVVKDLIKEFQSWIAKKNGWTASSVKAWMDGNEDCFVFDDMSNLID